jgi:hypothetical protein
MVPTDDADTAHPVVMGDESRRALYVAIFERDGSQQSATTVKREAASPPPNCKTRSTATATPSSTPPHRP